MNAIRKSVENAAIGVGVANTIECLSTIHHPGCAAVIWRRQVPDGVEERLATMPPDALPQGRVILKTDDVHDAMTILCEDAEADDVDAMNWLIRDVTALADRFGTLVRAPYLRLRLEAVTTNACRRFHVDAVMARLICTYRGIGTQYGVSTDGADPARVFTVPTGAPVILRGTEWPTDTPTGLLHRSPPIAGTGETRLLLVLDPIIDPEDEI